MKAGSAILTPKQNDSMEWHHTAFPKARTMPSAGKSYGNNFL
jgi:hypothetical protein